MLLNINATRAFILCFLRYEIKTKFRIATVAMFTSDHYAGGYGPRPDGVETEDKADPYEIGKRPLKVSKVSIMRELSRRCRHRHTTSNGYARLWSIV